MSERDLDDLALEDEQEELGEDQGAYRFEEPEGESTSDMGFLTKLWGSTSSLQIIGVTTSTGVSAQVADVRMPEPLVCAVYFQGSFSSGTGTIQALTLNLNLGLGRTTVRRSMSFLSQPSPGTDLEVTIPFTPMVNLLANVTVLGFADTNSPEIVQGVPAFTLALSMQVAPLTRAQFKVEAKSFGMALEGEADEMDNEMLRDLEPVEPSASEIMSAGRLGPPLELVEQTIAQLEQRLRRRPTEPEVKAALARMEARRARRGGFPAPAPKRAPGRGSPQRRAFVEQVIGILSTQLGRRPSKAELRTALASFEVPR